MHRLILAFLTATLLFSVTGCGQSGPLYLPGNPSRIETSPPDPVESEQEEDSDEERRKSPPD